MKWILIFLLLCSSASASVTHYVDINSTNPISPYTNWNTAATSIQNAINSVDYFATNDSIVIARGVYQPFLVDALGNKLTSISSVGGPNSVIVDGGNSSRCAEIRYSNVTLEGITFQNGRHVKGDLRGEDGGCIYFYYGGNLINCVVRNGYADGYAGGIAIYQHDSLIINCVIVNNSSRWGWSGLFTFGRPANVYNSIIYYNNISDIDISSGNYWNCVIGQMPINETSCITSPPSFVATNDYHIENDSPCIDAGTNAFYPTLDMDLFPRPLDGNNDGVSIVDIGIDEYYNPASDDDRDGISNQDEWTAGTDPFDATDVLRIENIFKTNNNICVQFYSKPARIYTIRYVHDLMNTNWLVLTNNIVGTGDMINIFDNNLVNMRFYRLYVQ